MRSILTFVLVVVITTLLWVLIGSQQVHAVGPEANWSGDTIVFDNHGYSKTTDFKDNSNTIPDGATVYQTPPQTVGGSSSKKVFVIYFSSGVDPPTAKTAQYVEFDYSNNGLSNPQNKKDITITEQGEQGELTSCSVEGIGWIICPLSVFIAGGMDWAFGILATFIAVQPSVLGDPNNGMYVAWNVMRNIANVAFVIAFLIIIYSQLTSFGVSNYGLKKLIPRLIIAAILVNVSFIISALAIDISNVLGYSIQNIFNIIRENVFNITNDNFAGVNSNLDSPWKVVTAAILAGGGIVGGFYYISSGAEIMLVPLLLGLVLTLIFVIIVLAARQAIIVILVIIAPLAFVANLLPNTEKWFDKWKDLFMTMLIFFPAFSLVFGGSQLAGQLIIQNAGDNIVTVLFGMAVQIAPLVITPLLLKFSGSLLGRIAQIANNPSKGILDRNKAWAASHAENLRYKNIRDGSRLRNPLSWGNHMVRGSEFRKRNLQERTNQYKLDTDNLYHGSRKYQKLHTDMAGSEEDKAYVDNRNAEHIEHLKSTPGKGNTLYDRAERAERSRENLEYAKNATSQHYNERRIVTGDPLNVSSSRLEASKATLEKSEKNKSAYFNTQRMMAGTVLNSTVAPLEASRLLDTATQGKYDTMVENMKLDSESGLYQVAQDAESSKETLQASQANVQALFDRQRQTAGTGLYASNIQLETSKSVGERAKADLTAFVQNERTNVGGSLRQVTIDAENSKQAQQITDARLSNMVDEFKSGKVNPEVLTDAEKVIMGQMRTDASTLYATKQAGTSAQYEVQRNIAEDMTGTGPVTDAMLDIAQGVGGETARFRAQAQAVKASKSLDNDALASNVELLKNTARNAGSNIKHYSNGLLRAVLNGLPIYENQYITAEMTKAALQAQAEEKNVPLFEEIIGSTNFNQAMVREIVDLNSGPFKGAGAFGIVDNPKLNIDNYDTKEAFEQDLNVQRVSNLANANSTGLAGLKFGWVANSLADPKTLKNNIESVLIEIQKGKAPDATEDQVKAGTLAEASLLAAFKTVRGALQNEDTLNTMTDRESFLRTIEAELARVFGTDPLPAEPFKISVDANSYAKMDLPKRSNVAPNLSDAVDDDDDTIVPPKPEQP
ncbi:MAG: rane protein of unknown function [Candidatus Saccharibacteria bacterium]|nr:rane protein of unknown function [Candidatus Saccharibacteria bacterium]